MENEELNKKITEWLGLCWHEFTESDEGDPVTSHCSKCGKPDYEYDLEFKIWEPANQNIEFTNNPNACFEQIVPELNKRGLRIRMLTQSPKRKKSKAYFCSIGGNWLPHHTADAETASLAICKAAEKSISRLCKGY